MNSMAINLSNGIYAATPDYVHAMMVDSAERVLFVSGTMGLEPSGHVPATLEEQLEWVWQNIRTILRSAHMTTDNIVRVTSYLTDREHADANQEARLTALGNRRVPTTAIIVQTINPLWLIELEVVAVA